jgi:hypothetical protein
VSSTGAINRFKEMTTATSGVIARFPLLLSYFGPRTCGRGITSRSRCRVSPSHPHNAGREGATGGAAKKGPTSVLSRVLVNNTNSGQNAKTARSDADTDNSLDVIKLEEAKYASICVSVLANPKPYMASGIFDLSVF